MKKISMPCPRCQSKQRFGKQRRRVAEDHFEIFIRCDKCRWEKVIMSGSHDTIYDYRQIERLKIRAKRDPALNRVLLRKLRRLNESLDKE